MKKLNDDVHVEFEKYFVFFLCGYKWTDVANVLSFLNQALEILVPGEGLTVAGYEKEKKLSLKPSLSGDFSRLKNKLRIETLQSLIVGSKEFNANPVYFLFENENEHSNGDGDVKASALSISRDVWKRCELTGDDKKIITLFEDLFLSLGAIYGYGNYSNFPIVSSYDLIWLGDRLSSKRILDFDYKTKLEKICKFNLVSRSLIEKINALDSLSAVSGVRLKDLTSGSNKRKVLSIYFDDFSIVPMKAVESILRPLIL